MLENFVTIRDIKPVVCGYIREAQFKFDPDEIPDENVVHEVRVLMKKSRASIRLLKSQMDKEIFAREYSSLREVGRIMRSWRETSVHRKLLKSLKRKYPKLFSSLSGDEKINALISKQDINSGILPQMKDDILKIMDILHKSGYRWRFRSMNNIDSYLLFKELQETYSKVSVSYLKARIYPGSVNLHEFRKKAKDFLYQLYFFRSVKPKAIKELEIKLDSIAQNLGKYNDHAVLMKSLGYKFPQRENNIALDELIVLIKEEQDRFLSKVWPSAFSIFRPGRMLVNVLGVKLLLI
jgi:CHAD domain-containing protein